MSGYAHPEMLADTAWVAANLKNSKVRMVEVDVDALAFEQGHVPGALAWSWATDLCDTIQRDILAKSQFECLMAKSGNAHESDGLAIADGHGIAGHDAIPGG
jgi:thiosulfate/3-mercaptopyruvate sulfurtransferase